MMRKTRIGVALLALCAAMSLLTASASAATFSNAGPITINDASDTCTNDGKATPYPSQIQVAGLGTPTSDVNATINGFSHTSSPDVRMLLVGPHGQSTLLYDRAGFNPTGSGATNVTITFDDAAPTSVPAPPGSGTFKPTQSNTVCAGVGVLPSPAPAGPYGTDLAGFNGTDPNGTWSLYVIDDTSVDTGTISGGWSLDVTAPAAPTTATTATPPPAAPRVADPKCAKLRKKLNRQKQNLAKAVSDSKRSKIEANIEDTQKRLKKLGCT